MEIPGPPGLLYTIVRARCAQLSRDRQKALSAGRFSPAALQFLLLLLFFLFYSEIVARLPALGCYDHQLCASERRRRRLDNE